MVPKIEREYHSQTYRTVHPLTQNEMTNLDEIRKRKLFTELIVMPRPLML